MPYQLPYQLPYQSRYQPGASHLGAAAAAILQTGLAERVSIRYIMVPSFVPLVVDLLVELQEEARNQRGPVMS